MASGVNSRATHSLDLAEPDSKLVRAESVT
jgi:hypothetical protein